MITRPLHPGHRAILTALAERGPSVAADLGVGIATDVMHILVGRGWCFRVTRTNQGIHSAWLYDLTEAGRSVLAAGTVKKAERQPNVELHRNTAWHRQHDPLPPVRACVHLWQIASGPRQDATCQRCGEAKSFGLLTEASR